MLLTTDYASRNIGDVFFTLRKDAVLNGAVPCDGSEYSASDFSTISEDVNPYSLCVANRLPNVDYATYDLAVKNNGSCASFGIDTINGKFKVPTIKNVFIEAGDTSTLAKYMAPSVSVSGTASIPYTGWGSTGSNPGTSHAVTAGRLIVGSGRTEISETLESLSESKTNVSTQITASGTSVQPKSLLLRPMVQLVTVSGDTIIEGNDGEDSGTVIPTYTIPYVFVPGTEAKATEVNANFDYVLSILRGFSIDSATAKVVHLDGDEIITGQKTFVTNPIISSIEIKPDSGSPYIDFHYNGESSDYSARIIEGTRGYLQLNQNPPTSDSSTKIATTNWVSNKVTTSVNSLGTTTGNKASWTKLPNGMIIQYGYITDLGFWSSYGTYNFPTAFPNSCVSMASASTYVQSAGNKGSTAAVYPLSRSQYRIHPRFEQNTATVQWIAVGY
jgi:hypothetical protein